jgi:hypothetical protein
MKIQCKKCLITHDDDNMTFTTLKYIRPFNVGLAATMNSGVVLE